MPAPFRSVLLACVAGFGFLPGASRADSAFDLAGPSLRVAVTHDQTTLPLSQVPNLAVGDKLRVAIDLPPAEGAHYRMVLAFLRGATNPPPKDWLFEAQTWKPGDAVIDAAVPVGAEQAVVLLVPDTHGASAAVSAAIRGRPGAFVRASQELNAAMLDRARLETFVDRVSHRDPAELAEVSPQLAKSLAVKLDTDCLLRQPDARAACLTQSSNAAVLADGQTSSIAQTLAGAPADVALDLSATPRAGFGYYSPYIGLVRDMARILGAFQTAQLQFLPALSVQHGDTTGLLLNAVPSFRKPQSVLVAALPGVAPPVAPPLAAGTDAAVCLGKPDLVLPVTGAPLVFATGYARQMALRVRADDGHSLDVPVSADPARGGFVVTAPVDTLALGAATTGVLHGWWGFQPFDGPSFALASAAGRPWHAAGDAALIVGRETPLRLSGGAAACVAEVTIERAAGREAVSWAADGRDGIALKVPLVAASPGPVTIAIRSFGAAEPQRLTFRAFAEAGRLAGFTLHAGDRAGVLAGTRLDQVSALEIGGVTFGPEGLEREGAADRLSMTTDMAGVGTLQAGQARDARVTLADGRTVALKVVIAAARPQATLLAKSVDQPADAFRLTLSAGDQVPQDARLTFSVRARGGTRFTGTDRIEVEAADTGQTATLPVSLQDPQVAIAAFSPATALGQAAHGPLLFRIIQGSAVGDWSPLATLVRVPTLTALSCPAASNSCFLSGAGLFLVSSIASAADPRDKVAVPDGFTGSSVEVPKPAQGRLSLVLRDSPGEAVIVSEAR